MRFTSLTTGSAIAVARSAPESEDRLQLHPVVEEVPGAVRERGERGHGEIREIALEAAELRAGVGGHDVSDRLPGQGGEDRQEVRRLGPALDEFGSELPGIVQRGFVRQALRIGPCPADLPRDRVRIVGQSDPGLLGRVRLRHLRATVAQAHHPGCLSMDQRFDDREELAAVVVVELLRDIARELQVLALVIADRDPVGPVGEDVGSHQARVHVEARRGVLPGACRPSP